MAGFNISICQVFGGHASAATLLAVDDFAPRFRAEAGRCRPAAAPRHADAESISRKMRRARLAACRSRRPRLASADANLPAFGRDYARDEKAFISPGFFAYVG